VAEVRPVAPARHSDEISAAAVPVVRELLLDALARAVTASDTAAARLVVVDAIDDHAARFYTHHGFTAIPGDHHRLVQKMSDVAAALRL
jgi:hypothetical protein